MNNAVIKTTLLSALISIAVPVLADENTLYMDIKSLNLTEGSLGIDFKDSQDGEGEYEGYITITAGEKTADYDRKTSDDYRLLVRKSGAAWYCTQEGETAEISNDQTHIILDIYFNQEEPNASTCVVSEHEKTDIYAYVNGLEESQNAVLNILQYDSANKESTLPPHPLVNSTQVIPSSVLESTETMKMNVQIGNIKYACVFEDGKETIENIEQPIYLHFKNNEFCSIAHTPPITGIFTLKSNIKGFEVNQNYGDKPKLEFTLWSTDRKPIFAWAMIYDCSEGSCKCPTSEGLKEPDASGYCEDIVLPVGEVNPAFITMAWYRYHNPDNHKDLAICTLPPANSDEPGSRYVPMKIDGSVSVYGWDLDYHDDGSYGTGCDLEND